VIKNLSGGRRVKMKNRVNRWSWIITVMMLLAPYFCISFFYADTMAQWEEMLRNLPQSASSPLILPWEINLAATSILIAYLTNKGLNKVLMRKKKDEK